MRRSAPAYIRVTVTWYVAEVMGGVKAWKGKDLKRLAVAVFWWRWGWPEDEPEACFFFWGSNGWLIWGTALGHGADSGNVPQSCLSNTNHHLEKLSGKLNIVDAIKLSYRSRSKLYRL